MKDYLFCIFAFLSALILTIIIESRLIPILKKRAEQPIYYDGPSWHLSKQGTPTMGGIAFVIAVTFTLLFISTLLILKNGNSKSTNSIIITALFALGNALVGIFDDLTKLLHHRNAGLTPIQKLGLQSIVAIIFLMARKYYCEDSSSISLWFGSIELGPLYYPFALIMILGVVNCANLTDGIDGLASSVALTIGALFLLFSIEKYADTPIISLGLIGGALGFLLFNRNPAKIFMGDTGSLFLGAIASALAFSIGNLLIIIPIGIVYVIEGISVIMQVIFFKLTKKRLFKMAPLHHHFEKNGMSENGICLVMVIITLIAACLAPLIIG